MGREEELRAMQERAAKLTELLNGPDTEPQELREAIAALEEERDFATAGRLKIRLGQLMARR